MSTATWNNAEAVVFKCKSSGFNIHSFSNLSDDGSKAFSKTVYIYIFIFIYLFSTSLKSFQRAVQ